MNLRSQALWGPMRLPFLILAPACVVLGAGTAWWNGGRWSVTYFVLALLGGLAAHISVNALNEYQDFKSGLDLTTRRTPFSGGSGALPANPQMAHLALATGLTGLGVTGLIGLFFLYARGLWLLPLGLVGMALVVFYTSRLTKNPYLCLAAPGLGFGTMMVMGTDFVLSGAYSWTSFTACLVPFFLVSDLLLLNQFPDMEADRKVARRHLPIVIGTKKSAYVYAVFLAGTYLTILVGWMVGVLPGTGLVALVTVVLAVPTVRGAVRYHDDIPRLLPHMGKNVVIVIGTIVLLAAGLFVGG